MAAITRTEAIEQIQVVLGGFVCYKNSLVHQILITENLYIIYIELNLINLFFVRYNHTN